VSAGDACGRVGGALVVGQTDSSGWVSEAGSETRVSKTTPLPLGADREQVVVDAVYHLLLGGRGMEALGDTYNPAENAGSSDPEGPPEGLCPDDPSNERLGDLRDGPSAGKT
jgi:hypothetical protein